jgi:polar amino acid transport system substrate-binding protein
MAAEIAYRTSYDKLDVVNVGWAPLVSGQTSDIDFAFSQISITDERKKVVDF